MLTSHAGSSYKRSISKFLTRSESHANFKKEFREGGAFGIEAVRISAEAFEQVTPAVDDFTIGMGLGKNVPSDWDFGDGWVGEKLSHPGSSLITPAGVSASHKVRGANDIIVIACPQKTLKSLLQEHGIPSTAVFDRLVGQSFIQDLTLRVLIQNLWKEAANEGVAYDLMVDAFWQSIVARLLQLAEEPLTRKSFGLTRKQITKIDEYIVENLGRAFNTQDLAELVNLPLSQFSKDFREATGCSPYQYVLSRRLERAQHELATTSTPLAAVAIRCGFSSQSHMTDVFRDKLGSTPGKMRKELKS
ncbi:helix-turn-helix domain-containing protein [Litoreibacter roseus]|uniref:HTH araC/xylS-type domain-containing protein n=1 Tax=Litoreibacter roseus TaxID=2601869 RepID=A0A6N6JLS0_9RHOB|nr:AraC family transcriptional regulator [Litoreibacter roseus]GFE67064.1 hypothetical protein KIN_41380 [Litoreibacter roseus]